MTPGHPIRTFTYRGNITGSEVAQPGELLGYDDIGRPYEVIDAEYIPADDKTLLFLQYAAPENIKAAFERTA